MARRLAVEPGRAAAQLAPMRIMFSLTHRRPGASALIARPVGAVGDSLTAPNRGEPNRCDNRCCHACERIQEIGDNMSCRTGC